MGGRILHCAGVSGPAIEIEQLRKVFPKGVEALAGVELEVPRGCVFGLLGPNGAGKSTMVKALLTILRPTQWAGRMLGEPLGTRKVLGKIGYLPEHARYPEYLTGRQVVELAAGLCKVPRAEARRRSGELLDRVGMEQWKDRKLATYSKGMRQRVGLAQALVNDPELVFLDEPTDGVDPGGRKEIRELMVTMRGEGRTVFVNSHLLSELEQVADRVAILSKGRVVLSGDLEELIHAGRHRSEVRIAGPVPPDLRERFEAAGHEVAGDRVVVDAAGPGPVQPVIDALRGAGLEIRRVAELRQSLEDLFLAAVGDAGPGANITKKGWGR